MTVHHESQALSPGPIRDLFLGLRDADVPHLLLRGYEPLSSLEASVDLDVWIPGAHLARARQVLKELGWLERRNQTGRYPHVFFDFLGYRDQVAIMLDVVTEVCFDWGRGLRQLRDPGPLLARSSLQDVVQVPAPWHTVFLLALHQLLDKRGVRTEHVARFRRHLGVAQREDPKGLVLRQDFGEAAAELVLRFSEWFGGDEPFRGFALRREAASLPMLKARRVWGMRHECGVRGRRRRARAVRVAMIGLDGAGKTTQIGNLLAASRGLAVGKAYLGYNDFETRSFRWVMRQLERSHLAGRHTTHPLSRFLDLLRDFLLPVELRHRMRRAEFGKMLVFYDRYPLPGLDGGSSPSTLRKAARRIQHAIGLKIPEPDLVLFLDGDPETLWARKKEYPLQVYLETRARYVTYINTLRCETAVIRTDVSVEESLQNLVHAISSASVVQERLYVRP
jgi:thymidylate kinase